ncbi:MAG TPA: phosphate ABC transporter permease subunit PstC [Bacteroidota bacterium]|nr:phosphate ABC transporter permease subunit PstC [Bacteroidota bacterium]
MTESSGRRAVVAGGRGETSLPPAGVTAGALRRNRTNPGDRAFRNITRLFAFLVLAIIAVMVWEMYRGSRPAIDEFGLSFLTSSEWDPVRDLYGALPFIYGTVVSSLIALAIALPLSLGTAIFLSELAPPWIERPVAFMVELLAAIPSIVYGLWGMFVLVPWLRSSVEPVISRNLGFIPLFRGAPYGFGMLAAGIILAIMILPIITSISRDVLRAIPGTQREAALAIGATRWESTRIILASGKSGFLGATLLGLGRAVGETMAVTMVIGNRPEISVSVFDPGYSMASVIANEFAEATTKMYTSALVEIALVLFGVTLMLNVLARLIVWSVTGKAGAA